MRRKARFTVELDICIGSRVGNAGCWSDPTYILKSRLHDPITQLSCDHTSRDLMSIIGAGKRKLPAVSIRADTVATRKSGGMNDRIEGGLPGRGSGMLISFDQGAGSVFHAGLCEWVAGL